MWSKGVALASRTSVKASARLFRKLRRCSIPRCFSLATKVMHIINPYTCNALRRFVHVYMDFRSSTGRLTRANSPPHRLLAPLFTSICRASYRAVQWHFSFITDSETFEKSDGANCCHMSNTNTVAYCSTRVQSALEVKVEAAVPWSTGCSYSWRAIYEAETHLILPTTTRRIVDRR